MSSRSLLIVEDNSFLRELLAVALESKGFEVQTAGTAADAKRMFGLYEPDGVIIDIDLGAGPAFGRVKGKLKVPDSLAAGKYTLQVNGYTKKKQLVKSSNLGMEVVEDDLGSLYFDADSYKATDETRDAVKEMAKSLDAGETVILYGYTSGNPGKQYREYNMYLAKKRTKTIKALFAAEGVQATIVIEPQGAVSPYGSNGGNENNRRVDVKPSN